VAVERRHGDRTAIETRRTTMQVSAVMTSDPRACTADAPLEAAAQVMRDEAIGDVLVCDDDGRLRGIVTDRDLVVRGLATGDVSSLTLADVCTADVQTVTADADVREVLGLMQDRSLRRVPVVDGDRPVGIVSLGDLAAALDRESTLGQISSAPPDD
jgi:CBS domain-containing protein